MLKSRRISGRLYEIRVHPIQSLHNGPSQSAGKPLDQMTEIPFQISEMLGHTCNAAALQLSSTPQLFVFVPGLMGAAKPPSTHSRSIDSAVPGICKELIGQSVSRLRGSGGTEDGMAERLASDLHLMYAAVQTISDIYDSLDDDSEENGEIPASPLLMSFILLF